MRRPVAASCCAQYARRMAARGRTGGRRPAGHVEVVVQHRPPAVLEEGPEPAALGLPAVGVQVQRPEPLGGEDRFVHLQLPPTRLEVEGTHGLRLLHLMVRVEILEEYEQRSPLALERDAEALGGETGAPRRELATEILNPDGPAPKPRQPGLEGPARPRPQRTRARPSRRGARRVAPTTRQAMVSDRSSRLPPGESVVRRVTAGKPRGAVAIRMPCAAGTGRTARDPAGSEMPAAQGGEGVGVFRAAVRRPRSVTR